MSCFHRSAAVRAARRLGLDDRGAAALEGIMVLAILAGVLLGALFLGMWGIGLQSAQMGARLLAFDAGDIELARMGRATRIPTQQFTTETWDTLVDTHIGSGKVGWLNGMFALSNDLVSGSVTGTQGGRTPGNSRSLFDYAPRSMGYHANGWTAALNSWGAPESVVQATFLRLSFNVGRYQVDTTAFTSMTVQPIPNQPPVLETLFGRAGIH
jgi:hypothetical protein